MIVTEILGNVHDDAGAALVGDRHREQVHLEGSALVKRIQRLRTDHGNEYGLRLPAGSPDLRDGDILTVDDEGERGNAVIVRVLSTDVLVISARSLREMAFVAHSLGNRHLPAQFFDADGPFGRDAMVVQHDHTVEDFLRAHDVPHERQERVMDVPFRHAEHTH
ncbi:urease accessory protein UreE [Micrococcus luteus]|uniref:urease accessory protein UreE n=1 Tax=Micrococcus luteus TaxID=1270 RepID=UPI000C79E46D|nr:urease accessory protein UreE [Micrococcus luteus]PLA45652.1 urease accessory protein UreE [Micrococcus luteus]